MKRNIISIDEDKCDGCGQCANGCPEGALRIIDGKARLVGDLLCDGLGACIGSCPQGAIHVEEREAEPYDERLVMKENIIPKGEKTILAHLEHLHNHGEDAYLRTALDVMNEQNIPVPDAFKQQKKTVLPAGSASTIQSAEPVPAACPGLKAFNFARNNKASIQAASHTETGNSSASELQHWPVQLHLINPRATYFNGSNFLLAADCSAFAAGDFHQRYLKNKTLAIACPKLDDGRDRYVEKLTILINEARIDTLTVLKMQVPCCSGLRALALEAREKAERHIPIKSITIDPEGIVLEEVWL